MTTEPTQRGSEGEFETAAETLWLSFYARMGGEWSGRDGSLASELCWVTAEKILRDASRRTASPVGVSTVTDEMVEAAMSAASEAYDTLPSSAETAGYVSVFHPAVFRLALQAALSPKGEAPEGWQLVPIELTGAMWVAGRKLFEDEAERYRAQDTTAMAMAHADRAPEKIWVAMLAAAPPTEGKQP
jgi:hypothetical protein